MQVSKNTQYSSCNKEFLESYANQIRENLISAGVVNGVTAKKTSSLSSALINYVPSAENTGRSLGYVASQTYGAQFCNWAVQLFAYRYMGLAPSTSTWSGYVKSWFTAPAVETLKMTVTPYALPFVEVAAVFLGGLTVPTAIALVRAVGGLLRSNGGVIPDVSEILKQAKDGKIVTLNGRQLTETDVKQIQQAITALVIITKILMTKCNEFRTQFLIQRSDGVLTFLDGAVVDKEGMESVNNLEGLNVWQNEGSIKKLISLLVEHLPTPSKDPLDKFVIKCSDGVHCNFMGQVVPEEDIEQLRLGIKEQLLKEANPKAIEPQAQPLRLELVE
jgi:hypothetical protein